MSAGKHISLKANDGNSSISGDLVVETLTHWQIAVGGKVSAFSKTEWQRTLLGVENIFGAAFQPTHPYPFKA